MSDRVNTEAEIKQAEAEKAISDQDKLDAIKVLLGMAGGRKWIYDLIRDCHFWSTTFTGNSTGMFNEGMRRVGLTLVNDIDQVDPLMSAKLKHEFTNRPKMKGKDKDESNG